MKIGIIGPAEDEIMTFIEEIYNKNNKYHFKYSMRTNGVYF